MPSLLSVCCVLGASTIVSCSAHRFTNVCRCMYVSPSQRSSECLTLTVCWYREYLLAVLLHLTLELLRGYPPQDKDSSLAGSLAAVLLKVRYSEE